MIVPGVTNMKNGHAESQQGIDPEPAKRRRLSGYDDNLDDKSSAKAVNPDPWPVQAGNLHATYVLVMLVSASCKLPVT